MSYPHLRFLLLSSTNTPQTPCDSTPTLLVLSSHGGRRSREVETGGRRLGTKQRAENVRGGLERLPRSIDPALLLSAGDVSAPSAAPVSWGRERGRGGGVKEVEMNGKRAAEW